MTRVLDRCDGAARRLLEPLDAPARRRLEGWLVGGGLVAAALLVIAAWWRVSGEPLAPDAATFRQLAITDLRWPYDTGYREPLHVWLARVVVALVGADDRGLRGLSVSLYGAALATYYTTTRALFGRGFAAVAFFFFALAPKNAALAVEGLRNFEVVIALGLVALATRRAVARPASPGRHALVGLASGVGALAYLTLILVTQSWVWSCYTFEKVRSRWAILALLLPLALITPHLIHNKIHNGDALHTLDRHARFYRNLEYQGRPGQLTPEERERDPYGGPPVTGVGYMLDGRTALEVVTITGLGAFRAATYRAPSYEAYRTETFHHWAVPLWLATVVGGLLILLRKRRFWWVLALVVLCTAPFVFLLGVHQLDGRLLNDSLFAWLWLLVGFVPVESS